MIKKSLLTNTPKNPVLKVKALVELEAYKKQLSDKIEEYRADLLVQMKSLDVLTLKTGKYTLSRAKRTTAVINDFNTLKKSLEKNNIPYVTEEVFSKQMNVVFRELIAEKKELQGLSSYDTEYIMIKLK